MSLISCIDIICDRLFMFRILSFILMSVMPPEDGGWVSVEKKQNPHIEHVGDEDDPSLWVLYSKKIGSENFTVRFPEDPKVVSLNSTDLEFLSIQGKDTYRLSVSKTTPAALESHFKELIVNPNVLLVQSTFSDSKGDLLYRENEKWIHEHLFLSGEYLFIFQTKSESMSPSTHSYFFRSFSLGNP